MLAAAAACPASQIQATTLQQARSEAAVGDLGQVGDVHLQPSCAPAVLPEFSRATALLHSFFYDEARRLFEDVTRRDDRCAIAYWGIAMTWWHPLWAAPTANDMQAGRAAIDRAKALGGGNAVERGLIAALDAFYSEPADASAANAGSPEGGQSCHGPTGGADHPARALAYRTALETLHRQLPHELEIGALYALALLGSAPPTDASLGHQRQAAELLESLYREHPRHPGVVHYLIHAYDYPELADKGVPAAEAYARIAPRVPHALHMPSHIFTRLGRWRDVIDSNIQAASAARDYAGLRYGKASHSDELHAMDYLVYGYLQIGQDSRAMDVVARAAAIRTTWPATDFAVSYATGAIPARYALERRQWAEAAALAPAPSPSWQPYPFGAAHVAFARAFGAVRAGRLAQARAAKHELDRLAASITDPRQQFFATQTQIQAQVIEGWLAFAEGRLQSAERILREAAHSDDALGKHPVSPGSLLPAREVLADYLSDRGRYREALAEFRATLKLNPKRFNGLYGAGLAAERSGERDLAERYYAELIAVASRETSRPEIAHARDFIESRLRRTSAGARRSNPVQKPPAIESSNMD